MLTIRTKNARKPHGGDMRTQPRKPLWNRSRKGTSRVGKFSNKRAFFVIWRLENENSGGDPGVPLRAAIKKGEGLRIIPLIIPLLRFFVIWIEEEKASCVRVQVVVFCATRERLLRQRPYMFARAQGRRASFS